MSALSPAVVAATRDLELAARLVVEGWRSGTHRSPFHGYNAEFQQHRPYRIGDDLKYLDWKLLARTDRLYSKQFRETTSMSVMIVLDTSASMAFPDHEAEVSDDSSRDDRERRPGRVSKHRYATIIAAATAYLIASQGDAVGLMTMAAGKLQYLPARGGRPHLRSLIARIDKLQPDGEWQPDRVIARAAELLDRRGVVLVISDFYDAEDETRRELRRAARRGHDIAMLQVITPEETTFPFRGALEFEDLESGQRQMIDAGSVAATYRENVASFLRRCRDHAVADGFDYALLSTDTPPEAALRAFLLRREKR